MDEDKLKGHFASMVFIGVLLISANLINTFADVSALAYISVLAATVMWVVNAVTITLPMIERVSGS